MRSFPIFAHLSTRDMQSLICKERFTTLAGFRKQLTAARAPLSYQKHTCLKIRDSRSLSTSSCPIRYRNRPRDMAEMDDIECEVLYVIGGLYGNPYALSAIEERVAKERGCTRILFNGDFNFFNVEFNDFLTINTNISTHHIATAGNVEVEISNDNYGADGCGCGYPSYVGQDTVTRSDRIVAALGRTAARAPPPVLAWLRGLPPVRTARVGGLRVGAIHGDPEGLAGWALGVEQQEPPDHALRAALGCPPDAPTTPAARVRGWLEDAAVDVLASAHTCLPFAQRFGTGAVFNGGAAGLPNFAGTAHGVATRVAADLRAPPDSLYGCELATRGGGRARVDCVPVVYDGPRFEAWFVRTWPEGSDAHASYFRRIRRGPAGFTVAMADRLALAP